MLEKELLRLRKLQTPKIQPCEIGCLWLVIANFRQFAAEKLRQLVTVRAQHLHDAVQPRYTLLPGRDRRLDAELIDDTEHAIRHCRAEPLTQRRRAEVHQPAAE